VTIASLFDMAAKAHQAGQLDRAEQLYISVLEQTPEHTDAMLQLSEVVLQSGRLEEAAALLEHATRIAPGNASYLLNLGDIYRCLGQSSQAMAKLLLAIARKPDFAEAVFSLAVTFEEQGDVDAALACYEQALVLKPEEAQAGDRLARLKAKQAARRDRSPARNPEPGLSAAEALAALGETLRLDGRPDDATSWYRIALKLNPRMANAHTALGAIHGAAGRLDEAIDEFRRALQIDESYPDTRGYLALALADSGRVDEALAMYRDAIARHPRDVSAHSALLFSMPFSPGASASDIVAEARAWNARHAHSLARRALPHENQRSPERRLRVGYVSPDFREHVLSLSTIPLLMNHDREKFEIFCYSSVEKPDGFTERIRGLADAFREVSALDDVALSKVIRQDRIDILVDLTMHMSDHRLLVFARRPAPIQLCWQAYPGTTGLETMDYRVSDALIDPLDASTDCYTEQTLRLASFWCYDPLVEEPEVSPLPALAQGRITFGSLNHFRKVNDGVLRVWARVLAALPRSRLLLLSPQGRARDHVRSILASTGVEPDRIDFVDRCGRPEYLRRYCDIDVGLDVFPYNGHTTSLDALWMGVPVVTLAGETVVGRAGASQAVRVDLPELIATTPDEYVRIASALASDLEHLAELRGTLRDRLKRSVFMDGAGFARDLESAYRNVWRSYCARSDRVAT
jgi:predicted O-linked N-acetylglucosamine transferase (SPINDLY family)